MFVQVIQGHVRSEDGALEQLQRWADEVKPSATGFLGATAGITDGGDLVAVARFRSVEAARKNATRPRQQAWWNEMEKRFDGPVRFVDSDRAAVMLGGGSDDAGFVQIIQSRLIDPDGYDELLVSSAGSVRARRPDVLGGVMALEGDLLTQVVYFRSEEAAREAEATTDPQEIERWQSYLLDPRYIDLHRPILVGQAADADDVAELHRRAVAAFDRRVSEVTASDWDRPTPCSEWSVRDLVGHIVGEDRWTPELLAGRTLEDVGDRFDGDLLGDQPLRSFGEAATAATLATAADDALEVTVHTSMGEITGREYVRQLFADHVIHAWDLARAIGADETLPPDLVTSCGAWLDDNEDMLRSAGLIAGRVSLDAPAGPAEELLARFGRDHRTA